MDWAASVAPQCAQGRHHTLRHPEQGCHVHGRGEHIVGRLPNVHVVMGVDAAAIAWPGTQQGRCAVGQHLVHVHVALRSRARLPHRQGEGIVVQAGQHFFGSAGNRLGLGAVKQAQLGVDGGSGLLDPGHGHQQGMGHALGRDLEVLQRTLGLRAPQRRIVHGHLAHGVSF
jgi:hypothetical protein